MFSCAIRMLKPRVRYASPRSLNPGEKLLKRQQPEPRSHLIRPLHETPNLADGPAGLGAESMGRSKAAKGGTGAFRSCGPAEEYVKQGERDMYKVIWPAFSHGHYNPFIEQPCC